MKRTPLLYPLFFLLPLAFFGLVAAGCAAGNYINYKVSPDYPRDDKRETLDFPGLEQPVTVYLDEAGIAHIEAQTELDLVRAAGFVQARSRFFEMDMLRRVARGRLSELVGKRDFVDSTTVDFDLSMRGWGFDKSAERDAAGMSEETRKTVQAFTDGVNLAIRKYKPLEYRLLMVDPEPWKPSDSFALGRLTAWSVSHNWHQELSRLILALHGGADRAALIYPHTAWDGNATLPPREEKRELPPAVVDEIRPLFPDRPYKPWDKLIARSDLDASADVVWMTGASNSWVVAADKSKSGKPIVANDPHMLHFLPSMMFQMHLKAPGLDAIGATVPGLPYILSGHNHTVAWGLTSACFDAVDLYVEKVNPNDPNEYLTADGPKTFETEEQIIRVLKDGKLVDETHAIRRSIHGPLLNDMYPKLFPAWAPPVSLHYPLEGVGSSMAGLAKANRGKTLDEVRAAYTEMQTPVSSWSGADVDGNIGYWVTGTTPIHKTHRGTFPVPGWVKTYEWTEFIQPLDMPYEKKTEGFYAHANNLTRNPEHESILYQIDSAPSYRYDRISELLKATDKHDLESMKAIQTDVKLLRAARIVPGMLADLKGCKCLGEVGTKALELLGKWDFVADKDKPEAAIFFAIYREAVIDALQDEVDYPGFVFIMNQRYSTNVADMWFADPQHVIWDHRGTQPKETRRDAMRCAFKKALDMLVKQQGEDPARWAWGELHDLHIQHRFGSQKAIAKFVNLKRMRAGGGLDSVWKSHFDLGHHKTPFRAVAGPVYRSVVDLADLDHAWWILDTGNSGWPGSPHYGDQHELWKTGGFVPMLFNWDEIKEKAKGVLTLQPPVASEK